MTSPNDIIRDAVEKLGVYAPSESISAADIDRGFQLLLNIIDQWSGDSIQLYQLITLTANLINGTADYTIGPGGIIDTEYFSFDIVAGPSAATLAFGGATTPIAVVSELEFNALYAPAFPAANPNPQATIIPTVMTYIASFPLGLIKFLPIPNAAGMIATFNGYIGLPTFATVATEYAMSPGQELALATNLAIEYNTYFGVGAVTPDLLASAQQTKTLLTYTNRLSRALSRRNVLPQTQIAPTAGAGR